METTDDVKEFINIARWAEDGDMPGAAARQRKEWKASTRNRKASANEDNILTVRTIIL